MKNIEQLLGLIMCETPEDEIIKKQAFYIVRKAVEKLNPKHKKIVRLFYWNEFSYREIAKMIGSTQNSVGVTLTNIKKKLRSELE